MHFISVSSVSDLTYFTLPYTLLFTKKKAMTTIGFGDIVPGIKTTSIKVVCLSFSQL